LRETTKTLIILSPGFPANEADSTCMPFPQLFVKTIQHLQPSLQVIVLAFQYPFIESEYQWNGVRIIAFNGRSRGKLHRLLLWKRICNRINVIVKESNVTGILNFWLGECALVGKYAAKKHGLASVTWLLGQDAKPSNRYFSLIRPSAKQLVALSDFLAATFFYNYHIMPAYIIPPGIDTKNFPASAPVRDIDILAAGSLIALKQYEIFIRVISMIAQVHTGIKARICGEGPERVRLQQLINDNGLSGNVELCGELSHHDVLELMGRSKIFLHPSSYEGFATVLTEALYAGCQVVCFCQPMNTVFNNQHVVKTQDGMTEKVLALLEDQHLNHNPVITWPIEVTCHRMLSLFGI
jgi:glycosyltransferase involved in cell wall biosynthesis